MRTKAQNYARHGRPKGGDGKVNYSAICCQIWELLYLITGRKSGPKDYFDLPIYTLILVM